MNRKLRRIQLITLVLLIVLSLFASASANIKYGESNQVNPQKTSIKGEGTVNSGYSSLSKTYLNYSLGGGVRAESLSSTRKFSGTVKIQLFSAASPNLPIAQHSSPASFAAQTSGYTFPSGDYYAPGYANNGLNIVKTQKYQYTAISTGIPSTVKIHYLCFLYSMD